MNIDSLFSGKTPAEREALLRQANAFLATKEGQALMQKISKNPSLQQKLREAQAGGISKLSKSDRDMILSILKAEEK